MKIKLCPKCNHRNISFASNCEKCNTELKDESILEIPSMPETVEEYKSKKILTSFACLAGAVIIYIIIKIMFS